MESKICTSIVTIPIFKFIIKSIDNDIKDTKLIFIGYQTDKTKDI